MADDDSYQLIEVPHGHIADVITHLEMLDRPELVDIQSSLTIAAWDEPDVDEFLELFRKVGEPWLWLSRLLLSPAELSGIIHDSHIDIFRIYQNGTAVGFIELDFRVPEECEIGFFGLVQELNGQGHGKWLMNETLRRAWREDTSRVWLHTCTLDSPFALGFYQKCGFKAFKREVSMNIDPRVAGYLPKTAAPQIPLIS